MDTNFSLVIILFISTLFHLSISIKTFLAFIPSLNPNSLKWENTRNFNYHAIITKMIFSILFFTIPILLFKHSKATLYKNEPLYFIVLIILILTTWFFIYFNKHKIWSPKHNFNTVINKLTNKNIDKIHNQLSNHSKKIVNIYELQHSQSKKTEQNTLDIVSIHNTQTSHTKEINVITKKTKNTYEQLGQHTKEITSTNQLINHANNNTNNLILEIKNLKDKIIVKPRKSVIIEQAKEDIQKGFKLFITDLESFEDYNYKEKTINYKKHDLTELQAYQILIEFFRDNYNVPLDKTYSKMFYIFNSHFDIKEKELKSNNWTNFKKRYIPDIKNNQLYNDLRSIIKN